MELYVSDKITIKELQEQFNAAFPYLKLEFFDLRRTSHGINKSRIHDNNKLLRACRNMHNEGTINISQHDTVEKLEKVFFDEFGLLAEVFRKSDNLWIETTLSDAWTLKSQNEEGRAFSTA